MRNLIVLLVLFFSVISNAQDFWQQLKGPEGGDVGNLQQTQDGTLYLLSRFSGYYRSRDNGNHWSHMEVPINDYRCYLAMNSKGDIFIATLYEGLLKSVDNGQSWTLIQSPDFVTRNINGIFIDKNDRIYLFGDYGNVFLSSDNGTDFRPFNDKKIIVNNIIGFYTNNDSLFYIATQDKIFISKNGGKTWYTSKFGQWIDFMQVNSLSEPFVSFNKDLYVSRDQGITWDTVYVKWNWNSYRNISFGKDSDLYLSTDTDSIFMTSDYGKTWKLKSRNGLFEGGKIFTNRKYELFHSAHNNGLYKFDTLSNQWLESNTGLNCQRIEGIETNSSGHVFTITPAGLYRSIDKGNSWKFLMSNENDYVKQVINVVKRNNHLYYGSSKGLFKSIDNGDSWEKIKICENCNGVSAISSDKDGIMYSGAYHGLYRSSDEGKNWTHIDSQIIYGIKDIFINDNGWIYVAGGHLYLSKDNGLTWKNLNAPTGFELIINKVYADKDYDIFLLMTNLPLLRSQDEGASWPWLDVNLWGGSVDFKVLPNGDYMVSGTDGIYISKDKGDNWILNSSGIKDWRSTFFTVDPEGYIYLGTYSTSIYKSTQQITKLNNVVTKKDAIQISYNHGYINLNAESNHQQNFDLSILNLDGKQTKSYTHRQLQSGKNQIEFPLNRLTPGVYFFQMKSEKQLYSGKFIVSE